MRIVNDRVKRKEKEAEVVPVELETTFQDGIPSVYEKDPPPVTPGSGPGKEKGIRRIPPMIGCQVWKASERWRCCLGENGKAVQIEDQDAVNRANAEFGFNTAASDKISLNRSIPDTRLEE